MAKGRKEKDFYKYIIVNNKAKITHSDYYKSPAKAFLEYTVLAHAAVEYCINNFPRTKHARFNSAGEANLRQIITAFLPAVMGHFETYQKMLFAGVFDFTIHLKFFDVRDFFKRLEKQNFAVDGGILAAYRGENVTSVGVILADNLPGWHNPVIVNNYFKAFGFSINFFDKDAGDKLKILWQLRHSIVHTGSTLTLPDSYKVPELKRFSEKNFTFDNRFISEVARKFHPLVDNSTKRIEESFRKTMKDSLEPGVLDKINKFFTVESPNNSWFNRSSELDVQ